MEGSAEQPQEFLAALRAARQIMLVTAIVKHNLWVHFHAQMQVLCPQKPVPVIAVSKGYVKDVYFFEGCSSEERAAQKKLGAGLTDVSHPVDRDFRLLHKLCVTQNNLERPICHQALKLNCQFILMPKIICIEEGNKLSLRQR